MSLARFTHPHLLVPRLRRREHDGILLELGELLQNAGAAPDRLALYQEAMSREFFLSTDPASGLAMPYARLPSIPQPVFAFGRSPTPIRWGTGRPLSVRLVLLVALPSTDPQEYQSLATGLMQLLSDPPLLRQLRVAPDAEALYAVFAQVETGTALIAAG